MLGDVFVFGLFGGVGIWLLGVVLVSGFLLSLKGRVKYWRGNGGGVKE
jgi:hypothetical protein